MSSQSGVATTPTRGGLRLLRAAALGGSSLALAGGAHLAGGGRLPGPATLGALALLVGTVAVALTGRRCRGPLLIGVLGIEQFALHIVLSAAAAPVRWADPGGAVHSALGHSALGHSALDHLTLPAAAQSGAAATMLVAHLLATVATAWLLARGEAWFWRVASQAMRILRAGPGHGWRPRRDVAPEFGLADVVVAYLGGDGAPRGPPAAGTLRVTKRSGCRTCSAAVTTADPVSAASAAAGTRLTRPGGGVCSPYPAAGLSPAPILRRTIYDLIV